MERPTWDEYFMEMAELTAKRSTCMRRSVGAVIVKDKRAIATGYNGAPKGIRHCEDRGGCLRQKLGVPSGQRHELCMALHAEQNAIIQAASMGHVNAGIKRIVVRDGYPDDLALEILEEAGLTVEKLPKEDSGTKKDLKPEPQAQPVKPE